MFFSDFSDEWALRGVIMVRIDICSGLWGKVSVVNAESRQELWQGKSGQTAEFESAPSMPIEIIWGILRTPNVRENVFDGCDYELIFRMTPFKAEYYLVQKGTDEQDGLALEG